MQNGLFNPFFGLNQGSSLGIEIEVIWVIGDSHATKRNIPGGPGPTPAANTVYQWDVINSNLYQIGSTDILQSGSSSTWGSIFPQYGIDRNADSGRMVVFICSGIGGSNYSPRTGDTGDWTDADTLWSTAKANFDSCISYLNSHYPNAILYKKAKVIMGVNDIRGIAGGQSTQSTVLIDITAFYTRFESSYPGMEISIVLPGRSENGITLAAHSIVRNALINEARARTNVHIACTEAPFASAGYYDTDNLHLVQDGNNALGSMMAKWDKSTAYSKWARPIIASHFDDLSSIRKDLINSFVATLGSYLFELEYLYIFKNTIQNNIYNSWCLLSAAYSPNLGGSFSYNANDSIGTNGTSNYILTGHLADNNNVHATATDFFDGVKIKTNRSAAGVTKVAIGVGSATSQDVVGQTNSNTVYARANDLTTTSSGADTKLQDDTFYAAYRTGTTKGLWKNTLSLVSATQAMVSSINRNKPVGCLDNNGTYGNFIDADFLYAVGGKYSTMDMSVLYNALETLTDSW